MSAPEMNADKPATPATAPAARRRGVQVITALLAAATVLALGMALVRKSPAPEVTFVSLQGEKIATADLRGKVVLVNFWATDCPTCVKEMPDVVATYEKFRGRGFETVAVAMRHDPPNYVLNYVAKNKLPFTVALDPKGELAKAFGDVRVTPTTFIVDKRGNIVARYVGEPDFPQLHKLLDDKLNES